MRSVVLCAVLTACAPNADLPAWGPPVRVTQLEGDDPSLTGDLLELYFENATQDIAVMTRPSTDLPFSAPRVVDELNSPMWDATPDISVDGLTIVLASDRDQPGNLDIWIATRRDRLSPWTPPARIENINSTVLDFAPTLSLDQRHIVFARLDIGDHNLFAASRRTATSSWSTSFGLGELNSTLDDSEPHLSFDGFDLAFMRDGDLWTAHRDDVDEVFLDDQLTINTTDEETDPWVSPDRRTLFFMRAGELWMSTR